MRAIPILAYHSIAVPPANSVWPKLYVPPKQFERQMWWLRRLGFAGCSVREAMPALRGKSDAKVAVITFDDGYADVYENALPLLQKVGFTATCYFVSKCIGSYNCWDGAETAERKQIMSREQVAAWAKSGMEIGSHTSHHVHLARCAPEIRVREIVASKVELEREFDTVVDSFSYPFGGYDAGIVSCVKAAHYRSAVTTRSGRALPNSDPFELRRIGAMSLVSVLVGVTTNYHNWRAA